MSLDREVAEALGGSLYETVSQAAMADVEAAMAAEGVELNRPHRALVEAGIAAGVGRTIAAFRLLGILPPDPEESP